MLHLTKQQALNAWKVTLDQDYNVPDNKSDIEKVIVENGEIQIQNIKTMPDKMILKGSLFWRMAYLKDRQNCTLDHMEGELPFEEVVNMDGLTEEARYVRSCSAVPGRGSISNRPTR